jgi:hypothetical protein
MDELIRWESLSRMYMRSVDVYLQDAGKRIGRLLCQRLYKLLLGNLPHKNFVILGALKLESKGHNPRLLT